jgi:hypothetical protein
MSAHVLHQQSVKPSSRQVVQRPRHVQLTSVRPLQQKRSAVMMAAAATEAAPVSSNGKVIEQQ